MLYPLTFVPIFRERVWGGRNLERLYRKLLPPGAAIGESWEVSDRPEGVSVIANGPLAGKDLRWLMEQHGSALLGTAPAPDGRFPLLVKLLDAQQTLSLQVHPPPQVAAALGGEPKTELWYFAEAAAGAELWAGLRRDNRRDQAERQLRAGAVAECCHRQAVRSGDAMFLPSGRLHALGAGNVIFEFQQNSDTTYRLFDWNRIGLHGRLRTLQIEQALACMDFTDFEPGLVRHEFASRAGVRVRLVADDPAFRVEEHHAPAGRDLPLGAPSRARIAGVVAGGLRVEHQPTRTDLTLVPGQFCLVPAGLEHVRLRCETDAICLVAEVGPCNP